MVKSVKLGHQAPEGFKVNRFNSIEIRGDFSYCKSHNFVYDSRVEEEKLYNGQPCYYTDMRFSDGNYNFYKNTKLHWTRFKDISLKSCIRRTLSCRNIPLGTIVDFNKSWYYVGYRFSNSYKFKIKKENVFTINYEINDPKFKTHFTNCKRSNSLVDDLRANGFLVSVYPNESFLLGMINTATDYVGGDKVNSLIDGEVAIAYGYGKKIGFSSFDNDFQGYSNGCEDILWDKFDEFNKWSRCEGISKSASNERVIEILKEDN